MTKPKSTSAPQPSSRRTGSPRAPLSMAWMALSMAAAAIEAAGCTASVSAAPPPPAVGSMDLDWTVDGTKDPAECDATGAASFRVTLVDSTGRTAGEWVQDCAAFATTIPNLVVDTYTGSADLVDANGQPRTTAAALAPFAVVDSATTTVGLDFPASSFF